MRSAIFLGLLSISFALDKNPLSTNVTVFLGTLLCIFMMMDVIEFFNK